MTDIQLNAQRIRSQDLYAVLDAEVDEKGLVGHHIDSFNSFLSTGINQIITQLFEIDRTIQNEREKTPEDQRIQYINFKVKFTDVKVSKPMTSLPRSGKKTILFPNMARKNDINYSSLVAINAIITAKAFLKDGGEPLVRTEEIKNTTLSVPIEVNSNACHMVELPEEARRNLQEDPKDDGGYFIIRGGEWVISMIESRLFNSPHIFRNVGHEKEKARLEFISKPGDAYENSSELIMRYVINDNIYLTFTSNNYFKMLHIPFYILFRLFGMTADKEIVDSIVYGYSTPQNKDAVSSYMIQVLKQAFRAKDPIFGPAANITDQSTLLDFVSRQISLIAQPKSFTQTGPTVDENLVKYLNANILRLLDKHVFPHIGLSADSRHKKLRYLGHLIHKLLLVEMQIVPSTDRDSLKNKRIAAAGRAFAKVFKTHLNLEVVQPVKNALARAFKNLPFSQVNLAQTFKSAINAPDLEKALIQAIATGNKELTVKNRQIPNRLASENLHRKNQLNFLSTLRVIRTPSTSSSKQDQRADEMRRVHASYAGYICLIQSADTGEQVGMVKQLSLGASVSDASSSELLKETLLKDKDIIPLERVFPEHIHEYNLTKVFVNGDWIGCVFHGPKIVRRYREARRGYKLRGQTSIKKPGENAKKKQVKKPASEKKILQIPTDHYEYTGTPDIDPTTTIHWDTNSNEINFWVDAGRMLRPLLVVRNNGELDTIGQELIGTSYDPIANPKIEMNSSQIPVIKKGSFIQDLVLTRENVKALFHKNMTMHDLHQQGIVDYISPEEMENCLIAPSLDHLKQNQTNPLSQYTHCEIPADLLGLPALTCPFTSHNQAPRITFQTNQSKQTCGWYSLNWAYRVDKHAFLQWYCELPIIKTIANKYLYPNGMNSIVAIACYGGNNQEDSLVYNESASQRGLFKGNQYNFIKSVLDKKERFGNPDEATTMDINKHANYEHLDKGMVKRGTIIHKDDVILGVITELPKPIDNYRHKDHSIVYNYNEEAMIEDVIIGKNQEGEDFAKVKFSSPRTSGVGDKYCLTPGSQILTTDGWINIEEITRRHKVATLVSDKYLEYHYPTNLSVFHHNGNMYDLCTQQLRIVCTPNHRLYVKKRDYEFYQLIEAEDVYGKRVAFKKDADWIGIEQATITFPAPCVNELMYPDLVLDMDPFLKFLGYWISDGWTQGNRIYVAAKKQHKINQMEDVCGLLGLEYEYDKKKTHFKIWSPQLAERFVPLSVGAINKFLPPWVFKLCRRQARILMEALIAGNGYITENDCYSYITSSNQLANQVTRLCLHAGWAAQIKIVSEKETPYEVPGIAKGVSNVDNLRVKIQKSRLYPRINYSGFEKTSDEQWETYTEYNDLVFCIEVPSHIMYYRYDENSPPFWIGNSSRHGQKGMKSSPYNQSDMLFTESGIVPDMVLSPFAIPSRMTIGQELEGQAAKLSAVEGSFRDATIFSITDTVAVGDALEAHGYDRYGNERMYIGFTGEYIDTEIFIAPCYYQRLQKFVVDEVYSISTGPTCILTRQPLEGKSNNGGLRIGEMEKDVIIANGCGHFLMEKFREDSDGFDVYVCRTCKRTPIVNEVKNIVICHTCKSAGMNPDVVKVRSTWASKLFIQELESANIGVLQSVEPYEYEVFENS
jgi:DNA-directed RNA polymerase beta subunit